MYLFFQVSATISANAGGSVGISCPSNLTLTQRLKASLKAPATLLPQTLWQRNIFTTFGPTGSHPQLFVPHEQCDSFCGALSPRLQPIPSAVVRHLSLSVQRFAASSRLSHASVLCDHIIWRGILDICDPASSRCCYSFHEIFSFQVVPRRPVASHCFIKLFWHKG